MAPFLVFFKVSGQTVAVQSPKCGCLSAEAEAESPYCGFELLFLVATATRDDRDTVPKVVLYSVLWSKYGRDD